MSVSDQLAQFEARIRVGGVWCDVSVKDKLRHYMICRNPKSSIAISRCGQIIVPFDKLHENTLLQKCFVCSLYEDAGEEVKQLNEERTESIMNVELEKYQD